MPEMPIARRFLLPAVLLVGIPFPSYLLIEYKSGELLDVVLTLAAWAVLAGVYWLPVGAVLFRWRGHWLGRLAVGYLVSVPLYFLALALVYPAFGYRFHPRSAADWGTYFSATPTFFVMVLILFFLVRGGQKLARVTRFAAAAAFLLAVAGTFVVWARVDAYRWPAETAARVEIINANVVDAAHNRILERQNVRIENGRIVSLDAAGPVLAGWPALDAQGGYLIPGLIDVHVHLQTPERSVLGGFDFSYFLNSILGDYAPQRREYLENGVTTIRSLGEPAAHIYALRRLVADHKLLGPRIFAVGRLVTSPHGHPASTIWTPQITRQGAILATSPANLVAGLEDNYAAGPPDAVKIVYGTIGQAREKISEEMLQRAVAWADGAHLISIVHIGTTQEAADAVAAGATGVEYMATVESLPDSLVAGIVTHHTFVDPTFGEFITALRLERVQKHEIDHQLQMKYGFIQQLYRSGARLTVGTDAPLVPYGQGLQDELAEYARAGFTPAEILTFATQNNAAYLGRPGDLGQIAPGYNADLFLVRQNPLANIAALRRPEWVMLGGQIVAGDRPWRTAGGSGSR